MDCNPGEEGRWRPCRCHTAGWQVSLNQRMGLSFRVGDECMGVNWEGDELEAPDLQKGRVRGRLQEELQLEAEVMLGHGVP